jgi:hypothetical protein
VGCEIACSVAVALTPVLSELSYGRLAQSTGGLPTRAVATNRGVRPKILACSSPWLGYVGHSPGLNGPRLPSAIKHQFMKNSMKNCSVPVSAARATKAIPL